MRLMPRCLEGSISESWADADDDSPACVQLGPLASYNSKLLSKKNCTSTCQDNSSCREAWPSTRSQSFNDLDRSDSELLSPESEHRSSNLLVINLARVRVGEHLVVSPHPATTDVSVQEVSREHPFQDPVPRKTYHSDGSQT